MRSDLAADFDEVRDITIVGGGPVGLSTAFWAGMRQASTRVVDSLPQIGGQCAALYPEKWIFDVPGHPRILAHELVASLREQAVDQFSTPVHLETTALSVTYEGDELVLHTDRGRLRSRAAIVACGHGAFHPKRLPPTEIDLSDWEGRGVHYFVRDKTQLAGRHVVIVGGGDSALDWTLNLLDTAGAITLVHRRDRFRAHERTVQDVHDRAAAGALAVKAPFTLAGVRGRERIEEVDIRPLEDGDVKTIPCEALLLQLGYVTKLGPLKEWGFALQGGSIVVDHTMKTSLDRIWACGDVTAFDGKIKLIATGFAEAAVAVGHALHELRPDMRVQPAYSTNTGVPVA